jgi:hypothetical protein
MPSPRTIIECNISRGGFASERSISVIDVEGNQVVGIADVQYLQDQNGDSLPDGEPPEGQEIRGFVACRVLRKMSNNSLMIDLPGAGVAVVPADRVTKSLQQEVSC